MKPKILVVDLNYYSYSNANAACITRILRQLPEYAFSLVAESTTDNKSGFESFEKLFLTKVHKTKNAVNNGLGINLHLLINKLKSIIISNDINYKRTADVIYGLRKEDLSDYQVILSVSSPIESHVVAAYLSQKYNIPWIAYYLDPFSTNYIFEAKKKNKRIAAERKLINSSSGLILTDPIIDDYSTYKVIPDGFEQVYTTKIPGIRKIVGNTQKTTVFDDKYINCLFLGNLYWNIRNPLKTIEFFEHLDAKYRLYFVGGSYGKTVVKDELRKEDRVDNKKVFFLDPVNSTDAESLLMSADILVNIGNSVANQIPSKLFDYISSGKPILNIYKTEDCPSLEILTEYPLAISIKEDQLLEKVDDILEHCNIVIGKKSGKLSSFYDVYSDWYVSNIVKNVICRDLNNE